MANTASKGPRHQARECALQLLFARETEAMPESVLGDFWDSIEAPDAARSYAEELADTVRTNVATIDKVITRYADNWRLDRMSRVDRNILRLAVSELFYQVDVPVRVTLDEAVELAKAFGGDESGRFVNGILDRVAREEARQITGEPLHSAPAETVPANPNIS